jgi:hypothetical protein
MVHVAAPRWTMAAMHMACALARQNGSEVALVKLIASQHVQWLGTNLGDRPLNTSEYQDIVSYDLTAQDYNVPAVLYKMQYVYLRDAIVAAADAIDAKIVFAALPRTRISAWHDFQIWRLRRLLADHGRQLFTLEKSSRSTDPNWMPSVLVHPTSDERSDTPLQSRETTLEHDAVDD